MFWKKKDGTEVPVDPELEGLTPEQIAEQVKAARALTKAIPENLKGLTPEQLAEKLSKSSDLENQVATLTTERDTLKNRTTEQPETEEPVNHEEASVWADPAAFIDKRTETTRNTALVAGMMAAKMYARQSMQGDDGKIFTKYENEIDNIVKTYPMESRVLPQAWLNALIYIKGLHMGDIMKAKSDGSDFFAEAPAMTSNEPAPVEKLTPDEDAMCNAMKWDKKKYLESRKGMQTIGDSKGMGHAQYSTGK